LPDKRRIILSLDGTWNSSFDEKKRYDSVPTADGEEHTVLKPTNPLKVSRAVMPFGADGIAQISYYDIGVGALAKYPGPADELLYHSDRLLGGVWGAGFEGNVEDALHFLALNYQPGDEVFIFGFSRGAAQARAVTQFLDWNGGLPQKQDAYYMPILFRAYVKEHGAGNGAETLAKINTKRGQEKVPLQPLQPFHAIPVKYLGVWDTVLALGSRFEATPDSTTGAERSFYTGATPARCVERARQALAVDEHRYDFRPEIWKSCLSTQTMEQRWFVGVHSNIGGGYGYDALANVTLGWMLQGAREAGLTFDEIYLQNYLAPNRGGPWGSLYVSSSLGFRIGDAIRHGDGTRKLVDVPPEANAQLDPSIIERMTYPAERLTSPDEDAVTGLYRPENVIELLAAQPDLDAYLRSIGAPALPADVQEKVTKIRRK
jgi:uncharacterized protein (DUF2235 family)